MKLLVISTSSPTECSYLFRKHLFAESKVSEDDMTISVQENILQLDVTIDNAQLSLKEWVGMNNY